MFAKMLAVLCIIATIAPVSTFAFTNGPLCTRIPTKQLRAVSELYVPIPPSDKGLTAEMKITHPDDTEIVVIRAPLPFGLDCEPLDGVAKVTKDNENGARVGDVLRYCSQFTMGLPVRELQGAKRRRYFYSM